MTHSLPVVMILTDQGDDTLAKRLWTYLPTLPEKRLLNFHDASSLTSYLDETLMIFIDLDHVSPQTVADVTQQVMGMPFPPEIIGILLKHDQVLDEYGLFCDAVMAADRLEQPLGLKWLRNKMQRAVGRFGLIATCANLQDSRAGLAASHDAYIVLGGDHTLLFASESYRNTYHRTSKKLVVGMPDTKVFGLLAEEIGVTEDMPVYQVMKDFLARRSGDIEITLDDDMVLGLRIDVLPNLQDIKISVTDITAFCQQQNDLAHKTMELEALLVKEREAGALQQQFISMVSHEFRTPLSIIDGNAQLLERHIAKNDLEPMGKRIRTIRSAVSRVVQMMEGVLSSNLLRSGTLELNRTSFDLRELMEQLVAEQRELAPSNVIDLRMGNVPDNVNLDEKLLGLIVTNLLGNAVKYGGDNPHVMVDVQHRGQDIIISVEDNGVGIPDDEKYRIFDKFYRASTSSGVAGTGIGLSLVRELVALHGGSIEVQSTVGRGSKFTVSLPL